MPTQWVDIVDTAVKIGLGAFISGFATYKVTELKNRKETEKESKAVHREMVLLAVEKTDEYFQFMAEYFARLDGVRQSFDKLDTHDEELWDEAFTFIKIVEDNLISVRNGIVVAQSRLRLLNMSEAIEALAPGRTLLAVSQKVAMKSDIPAYCRQMDLKLIERGEDNEQYYFLIKK